MIKLENISFSYSKEKIISDLSVIFEENKIYCIMGPSGVGKTTLLNLISGLNKPTAGKITSDKKLRKAFIFQENRLIPHMTVYENLRYVTDDDSKINSALAKTQLIDDKDKNVKSLSGGMARRVAIARATAFDGDIYFIDEPLYGLDSKTAVGILELIRNTVNGKTAFIITHSPSEAFYLADKLIFIKTKPVTELEIKDITQFSSHDEIEKKLLSE